MQKLYSWLLMQLGALLVSSILSAGVVYIRSDGPNDGDGRSWATAFNSIDAAIANIQTYPNDTTFWVAAGVYSPLTPYSPNGVLGGAAGSSFVSGLQTYDLPDGVKIYGGFKGDERNLSDRRQVRNPILDVERKTPVNSGTPNYVVDYNLTVLDGSGSESWHVITAGNDIALTGVNIKLYDLTIRGGFADGPDAGTLDPQFAITSLDYAHDAGGGIYARFGSVVDAYNVQFINNTSSGVNATILPKNEPIASGGGAIGAFDEGTIINTTNCYYRYNTAQVFGVGGGAISMQTSSTLNVVDCLFTDNTSNRTGGAIRAKDGGDVTVSGSYFERNIANDLSNVLDESGGALEAFQGNLYVNTSTFVNNSALIGGGALFFHTFLDDGTPYFLDVDRCYFAHNTTGPFGGGAVFIFGQGQHEGSNAQVRNSIFIKNSGGLGGAVYNSSYQTQVDHCYFGNNMADAWGGALAIDNFGEALLFPPLAFENRDVTTVTRCKFTCNKTRGVQPIPFGFPPFYTSPGFLNLFALLGPQINGIQTQGTVDPTIISGGGAVAVILAGVADISECVFKCNQAINGTGGGLLVGGVTGTVTDLNTEQTYNTFDYAYATVSKCKFKHNKPNDYKRVDLDNVGSGPDGVTLIIE